MPIKVGGGADRVTVQGIDLQWSAAAGTCTFQGLPVAMMWVDSTLAGLMSGLATMVGPERFSLALQSEGRKSVDTDWLLISSYPEFQSGFDAIGGVAAVAGWGHWQLFKDDPAKPECCFRAHNTWEGLYQARLGRVWGSAMLAGKFSGYCSKRFGVNCWATQTAFIAKGDPYDEFIVGPSNRRVEDEIERLLSSDQATRADMAVALARLREVQAQLLLGRGTLEEQVRLRTAELTDSLAQVRAANEKLTQEAARHAATGHSLQQAESLLRSIIAAAPICMAIVSMDGTIEYINQKCIETFGYLPDDIPNMDRWWAQAYPDPDYRREVIQRWTGYIMSAIAEARDIQRDTYRITCKNGAVKTVSVFGIPVSGKVFVMFDDVTEQAQKEDGLIRSREQLEASVRARTAEIAERNQSLQKEIEERRQAETRLVQANLALERTTIQLRKLGAKLARVEEHERQRMAHILHDQLQQSLVAASLGLSTIEQGVNDKDLLRTARAAAAAVTDAIRESRSLILDLSPPVLREGSLTGAMEWIRLRAHDKYGLTVQVRVDQRAETLGEDLRLAIFHAVRELLLNVVKHSGVLQAGVAIEVTGTQVRTRVSDAGRGYVPEERPSEDTTLSGFGMLAIRERFDALGGSMTVQTAPGQGCTVTLTAPIVESADRLPPPAGGEIPRPDPADRRAPQGRTGEPVSRGKIGVLLVDDHAMLRQGLADRLARDPHIVIIGEASDGEIAIQKARLLQPDVILMDISMPRMNGIDATRILHAEFPAMAIIGLSMYAEPHRAAEMRQAGAVAYVSKSEAAEALVATIHACCVR